MHSTHRPLFPFLVPAALSIAMMGVAGTARADDCPEAISEANARTLFDALRVQHGADGCALENVRTDRSRMEVEWKKNGALQPAVVVAPQACASDPTTEGRALSLTTPKAVASACPDAIATMISLVKSEQFGGLVKIDVVAPTGTEAKSKRTWIVAGVGLALVLAAGVASVLRKRGDEDEDDEDDEDEDEEGAEATAASAPVDAAAASAPSGEAAPAPPNEPAQAEATEGAKPAAEAVAEVSTEAAKAEPAEAPPTNAAASSADSAAVETSPPA